MEARDDRAASFGDHNFNTKTSRPALFIRLGPAAVRAFGTRNEYLPVIRLVVTSGHTVIPDSQIPDGGRFVSRPYDLKRLVADIRAVIDAPKPMDSKTP